AKRVLWFLDRESHELTAMVDERGFAPLGINLRSNSIDWWTFWEEPGTDPERLDGLVMEHFDPATKLTIRVETSLPFLQDGPKVLGESQLGLFTSSPGTQIPRVVVYDLVDDRVVLDVTIDAFPIVVSCSETGSDCGWMEPAWDAEHKVLYVPHLYNDLVTTVDLVTGSANTNEVVKTTAFLERLVAAWQPAAEAKGASSQENAVLSPDGAILYLTGKELDWSQNVTGSYREVPLGVVAVDVATMREVARAALPISRVVASPIGETLLATGSWDDSIAGSFFNSSGLHLLDATTLETVLSIEPGDSPEDYELVYSADGQYGYGIDRYAGPSATIIDIANLEVSPGPILERFNAELLELGYILDF
ncbi:MAG: YncE family protein, partial [Acidimicrobiia bacterium]